MSKIRKIDQEPCDCRGETSTWPAYIYLFIFKIIVTPLIWEESYLCWALESDWLFQLLALDKFSHQKMGIIIPAPSNLLQG